MPLHSANLKGKAFWSKAGSVVAPISDPKAGKFRSYSNPTVKDMLFPGTHATVRKVTYQKHFNTHHKKRRHKKKSSGGGLFGALTKPFQSVGVGLTQGLQTILTVPFKGAEEVAKPAAKIGGTVWTGISQSPIGSMFLGGGKSSGTFQLMLVAVVVVGVVIIIK